jgi:hypothetical protein
MAKVAASDRQAGDYFGKSVSLDGTTALVGATDHRFGGSYHPGAAYVFEEVGGGWIQTNKILPGGGAAVDRFGGSVSLDGDMAFVGAPRDDHAGQASGSAYLFSYDARPDIVPLAVALAKYTLSANQPSASMDGSGSSDDNGIVHYLWTVNESIAYSGPRAEATLSLADAIRFGMVDQGTRLPVVLTVTDTIGQAASALSLLSYTPFDAQINAFSATIQDDILKFSFEVQDDDLPVNALSPNWQVLAIEIDDVEALVEGDVSAFSSYWYAEYAGLDALVGPDDLGPNVTVDIPLWAFPAGWNTVWLNVAGSLDTASLTFYNPYPEPTTMALLALGALGIARHRHRRG